jgi:hypothetical protein
MTLGIAAADAERLTLPSSSSDDPARATTAIENGTRR